MVSRRSGLLIVFSLGVLTAVGASAQTGTVRGRVVDDEEQPIESVEIVIQYLDGVTREFTTGSNAKGDFVRVGLRSGRYKLIFTKEGYQSHEHELRVRVGEPTQVGTVKLPKLPEGMRSNKETEELGAAVTTHFQEGVAAADRKDWTAAIAAFEKVLELNPDAVEAHYNIGFAREKLGELDQALSAYQKAIELRPEHIESLTALANIYAANQQWPEAFEVFKRAAELQPDDIETLFNLGAVAMNVGNIAAAEEAFEQVIELDANHALGHYQLGMVLVNQAKSEEAIFHLEKYLELEPEGQHRATATGVLDYLKKN